MSKNNSGYPRLGKLWDTLTPHYPRHCHKWTRFGSRYPRIFTNSSFLNSGNAIFIDVLVRLQGWFSEGAFSIFELVLYPVLAGGFFLANSEFLLCLECESDTGKDRDATEEMSSMVKNDIGEEFMTTPESE